MVREGLRINDFEPGDVIFVRTGDAYKYWTEDPEKPRNDRLVSITIRRRLTIERGSGS